MAYSEHVSNILALARRFYPTQQTVEHQRCVDLAVAIEREEVKVVLAAERPKVLGLSALGKDATNVNGTLGGELSAEGMVAIRKLQSGPEEYTMAQDAMVRVFADVVVRYKSLEKRTEDSIMIKYEGDDMFNNLQGVGTQLPLSLLKGLYPDFPAPVCVSPKVETTLAHNLVQCLLPKDVRPNEPNLKSVALHFDKAAGHIVVHFRFYPVRYAEM